MSVTVELSSLTPAAEEGWSELFDLAEVDSESWVLLGGQMVSLHAAEHGAAERARSTEGHRRGRRGQGSSARHRVARCVALHRGFELDGISPDGIGHRFWRRADPGPGRVLFDVLAPEGLGSRTTLFTEPPARTVQVPGSKQAIDRSEVVDVTVTGMLSGLGRTGRVQRPSLLAAIIAKAAATARLRSPSVVDVAEVLAGADPHQLPTR
jgi:hypothetical protein